MTLPQEFESYTKALFGPDLYATFKDGLALEPSVSIRLNPLKCNTKSVNVKAKQSPVEWCDEGIRLGERPNFTADPLFHAGVYYVQEASSMFVAHALRTFVSSPVVMLDLCAAPGGKSTAARSALPEGSLLVANEPLKARANVLSENIQKFGHPDVIVTNNYPRDFRRSGIEFDVVLADVPCSGEGMFRKDEGAIADWSTKKVTECAALQRDIITDIWSCLRPGGLLIYSTCTFNSAENEQNIKWIANELGGDILTIPTLPEWNISPALQGEASCCRFIPGKTKGEGLFMAAIRKHGEPDNRPRKARKGKGNARPEKSRCPLKQLPLADASSFTTLQDADRIFAIRSQWADIASAALANLRVLNAGVTIGTMRSKALIPDQSLALSTQISPDAFPRIDVSSTQALAYLRREAITLPSDTPQGHVLICYNGHALGFVKNLGNRSNNLYPAEWRIKSTHITEAENVVVEE